MIQMSCPRCGAGGRVPREKTNARLVCKKCLQVFHLTPSGRAVIGEPPPPKETPKARAPREKVELDLSGLEGVREKLAKIRLPDPRILGAVAVVLVIIGVLSWIFSRESVETRTQRLTTAISNGDIGTVMQLALPGSEGDAMSWFTNIYQQFADLKISLGGQNPGVQIQVQDNPDGRSAQALVVFSRESGHIVTRGAMQDIEPPKPTKTAKSSIEFVVYWVPDTWGTWRFDAKQTAEKFAHGQ